MSILNYLDDIPTLCIIAGIRLLIIFTIMPIHEFAHAYAATKMGDDTAYLSKRLTLNPLAHIDPIGGLLLFFCGFGWAKPVPINPIRFKKYKKGIAITSFAGPLSNLICAAIGLLVYKILFYFFAVSANSVLFFIIFALDQFISINVGLAVFNLIPIPPLDGSKILGCLLSYKAQRFVLENERYMVYGLWILIFLNVLDRPLALLTGLAWKILELLLFWVEPLLHIFFG